MNCASLTRVCLSIGILAILATGCAQVPKESVQLSTTVGRDVGEIQKSHRQLVNLYYDRLELDVNRFIDNVYAPYQIQKTLSDKRPSGETFLDSLSISLRDAATPDPTGQKQKTAFARVAAYLELLRIEIEDYRALHLAPIKMQRAQLLRNLDEAYGRVQNANSIVTGYLASVVKVTDEQNELLARLGLPDLQQQIGEKAVAASAQLEVLTKAANEDKNVVENVIKKFEQTLKSLQTK